LETNFYNFLLNFFFFVAQENQQLLSPPLLNGTSLNFDTAGQQFAQLMFSSAAAAAGIPSSFSSFNLFNPFVSTSNNSIDSSILQQPSATTTQQQGWLF